MNARTVKARAAWVAAVVVTMAWPVCTAIPLLARQGTTGQTAGRGTGAPVQAPSSPAKPGTPPTSATTPPAIPAGYVIGPDDVLTIGLWKDSSVQGDVTVRPDGKISVAFVNEIQAAGLTPEELRVELTKAFSTYQTDPTVTLVVKQINSRKVYINGEVGRPGVYPLTEHMTVLNLISVAGGVSAYAHKDNISVVRLVNGVTTRVVKINYDDIVDGKPAALKLNIELKPGDQVIVP
jgi:polysaccharide export outer membrane protein